jgi:CTP synthase (UTP-ammonia lyase)
MSTVRIGLIGDFNAGVKAHQAIPKALALAGQDLGIQVELCWLATDTITQETALSDFAGLWCVPASPYNNTDGALMAIRFARESGRPFLGTCGGFQHALLEYARNVIGIQQANHAELDPNAEYALIAPLSCSLVEKSGGITLREGSRISQYYGATEINEEYHCNYGLNPLYEKLFDSTPLQICGRDNAGEVRAVELTSNPFFFATLFQPERSAFSGRVHPLIRAYVGAAAKQ